MSNDRTPGRGPEPDAPFEDAEVESLLAAARHIPPPAPPAALTERIVADAARLAESYGPVAAAAAAQGAPDQWDARVAAAEAPRPAFPPDMRVTRIRPRPPARPRLGARLRQAAQVLGGWPAFGGLATAAAAGLWLGAALPDGLPGAAAGLLVPGVADIGATAYDPGAVLEVDFFAEADG